MKLAKHYLNQVAHADQLQTVAFIIFFVLFLIILFWVLSGEKKMYAENGTLPLEDDEFASNIDKNHKTD